MHAFKQDIHGVILITGESHATVDEKLADIEKIFRVDTPSASIHKIFKVVGDVRPGKEKGHEQSVSSVSYRGSSLADTTI